MGNTSSQLGLDNSQNNSAPLQSTQSPLLAKDNATMDDPALRDTKKRRNVSGDATRPLKRSKKVREQSDAVAGAPDLNHARNEDDFGDGQEHAASGSARKESKIRSKKEHKMRGENEDVAGGGIATQDSLILEETPQSTVDTALGGGGDTGKRIKNKRKRPTGRPSGLNLLPEGMSDPGTQGGQLSPEMTNVQSSFPGPEKTKKTKTITTMRSPHQSSQSLSNRPRSQRSDVLRCETKRQQRCSRLRQKRHRTKRRRIYLKLLRWPTTMG
jgi:hypothetical protein